MSSKFAIWKHVGNGDIPIVVYNDITKLFEPVVNTRGNAYACRKQLRYRKHKD